MKNLFKILLCGLAMTAVFACTDNTAEDDSAEGKGGLIEKSCADREEISGEEQDFVITFKTDGAWTAKLSNKAFATLKEGDKGAAGDGRIVVSFKQNMSDAARIVTLSISINGGKSVSLCRFTQRALGEKGTDANVNLNFTWKWMDSYYLWNEDLRAALPSPDFEQPYDEFLDYLLKSINTNTMDGFYYPSRTDEKREWMYYSYIDRYPIAGTSSLHSATRADKEAVVGFGAEFEPMAFDNTGNVYFTVLWVYPKSPAAEAGLKRGDFIGKINGSLINRTNFYNLLINCYFPENGSSVKFSVCDYDFDTGRASYPEGCDKTIVAGYYYDTPVVYSTVFTTTETSAVQKKIGYLVYLSFESAYDDDLRKVFDEFKEKGITDIIIDLRYNGGGAVASSQLLTSILAGQSCLNKVFMYYRFNDERMKAGGYDKNDYTKYRPLGFEHSAATSYGFNFDKIYVIGTYDTASASELVINALRGIDKEVVLVGLETNGKNVGMEVIQTTQPIDGYIYTFAPISFQSYNAKGQSDYDDGFIPDQKIDFSGIIPRDWGVPYYKNPNDGKTYYADYVGVCLDMILSSASQSSIERRAVSRNVHSDIRRLKSPRSHIRRTGMYVELDEQNAEEK